MTADGFRYATLALALIASLLLPYAYWHRHPNRDAILMMVILASAFIGEALVIGDHFGESLVWYRAPRVFVTSLLALAYVADTVRDPDPTPRQ